MTRHAAYAPNARRPFASFPHPEAARRWVARHPDTPVRFVPPLPPITDDGRADMIDAALLGPCGCTDYHMADCPLRTGGSGMTEADAWAWAERQADQW